jgi:hypothetical protein
LRTSLSAIVGVAATCADFSTLSACANGMKATSSFVIDGKSTVLVVRIGFAGRASCCRGRSSRPAADRG